MRTLKYIFLLLVFLGFEQAHAWFGQSRDYRNRRYTDGYYDGYYGAKRRQRAMPASERYSSKQVAQPKIISAPNCKSEGSCVDDPNCLCYCSEVCHYRKKFKSDKPVFVAEDQVSIDAETGEEYVIPAGCYCKQWDLDVYTNNCKKNLGRKSKHFDRNMNIIGRKGYKGF